MNNLFLKNKELTSQGETLFDSPPSKRQRQDKSDNIIDLKELSYNSTITNESTQKGTADIDLESIFSDPTLEPKQKKNNIIESHNKRNTTSTKETTVVKTLFDLQDSKDSNNNTSVVSGLASLCSTWPTGLQPSNNIIHPHSFPINLVDDKKLSNSPSESTTTSFTESNSDTELLDICSPVSSFHEVEKINNSQLNNEYNTLNSKTNETSILCNTSQSILNKKLSTARLPLNNNTYTQNKTSFSSITTIDNQYDDDDNDDDDLFITNKNIISIKNNKSDILQSTSIKINNSSTNDQECIKNEIMDIDYQINNNKGSQSLPIIIDDDDDEEDEDGSNYHAKNKKNNGLLISEINLNKSILYNKNNRNSTNISSSSGQQNNNLTMDNNNKIQLDNPFINVIDLQSSILYHKPNKSSVNQKKNQNLLEKLPSTQKLQTIKELSATTGTSNISHNTQLKISLPSLPSSFISDKQDIIKFDTALTKTTNSNKMLIDQCQTNKASKIDKYIEVNDHSSSSAKINNVHNENHHTEHRNTEHDIDMPVDNIKIPINEAFSVKNPIYIHPYFVKYLKKHQIDGIKFMWKQLIENSRGCVLAHSMGLGKTLQVIVLIATLFNEIDKENELIPKDIWKKRVLILAPLTALSNWMNEFDHWLPSDFKSTVNHVYNAGVLINKSHVKKLKFLQHWYNNGGVCLMGYEQYRTLLSNPKESINYENILLNPSLFIADEGHKIKNATSSITQSVGKIKTYRRLCLTGYPLQNNLYEYYCMVDFTFPGLLGDEENFRNEYRNPIEDVYADTSESMRMLAKKRLLQLQLLVQDTVQRKSATILDTELFGKSEFYIHCSLTPVQYELYTILIEMIKPNLPIIKPTLSILSIMTTLRSICNHPSIIEKLLKNRLQNKLFKSLQNSPESEDGDYEEEYAAIENSFDQKLLDKIESVLSHCQDIENWKHSHKATIILSISKFCKSKKEKLVIVSHSLLCLDYFEKLLCIFGFNLLRLDGNTETSSRQFIIDKFNSDPKYDIFLISSKVGGISINITSANRMIIVDLDWNPSHDEQSIGRIYRFGQKKHVYIYRLLSHTTVESVLKAKNIHKRGISSRVVDNQQIIEQIQKETNTYLQKPEKNPEVSAKNETLSKINDDILKEIFLQSQDSIVAVEFGKELTDYSMNISHKIDHLELQSIRNKCKAILKKANQQHRKLTRELDISH